MKKRVSLIIVVVTILLSFIIGYFNIIRTTKPSITGIVYSIGDSMPDGTLNIIVVEEILNSSLSANVADINVDPKVIKDHKNKQFKIEDLTIGMKVSNYFSGEYESIKPSKQGSELLVVDTDYKTEMFDYFAIDDDFVKIEGINRISRPYNFSYSPWVFRDTYITDSDKEYIINMGIEDEKVFFVETPNNTCIKYYYGNVGINITSINTNEHYIIDNVLISEDYQINFYNDNKDYINEFSIPVLSDRTLNLERYSILDNGTIERNY